jgi:hypothetical protein
MKSIRRSGAAVLRATCSGRSVSSVESVSWQNCSLERGAFHPQDRHEHSPCCILCAASERDVALLAIIAFVSLAALPNTPGFTVPPQQMLGASLVYNLTDSFKIELNATNLTNQQNWTSNGPSITESLGRFRQASIFRNESSFALHKNCKGCAVILMRGRWMLLVSTRDVALFREQVPGELPLRPRIEVPARCLRRPSAGKGRRSSAKGDSRLNGLSFLLDNQHCRRRLRGI